VHKQSTGGSSVDVSVRSTAGSKPVVPRVPVGDKGVPDGDAAEAAT